MVGLLSSDMRVVASFIGFRDLIISSAFEMSASLSVQMSDSPLFT